MTELFIDLCGLWIIKIAESTNRRCKQVDFIECKLAIV